MIGIFDSGLGGLTVLRALRKNLPNYDFVYFGDNEHMPYGSKSNETVIKYSLKNAAFLGDIGAKMVVIACNSASSVATEILGNKFDIPVFEVITPAVELAVQKTVKNSIGVIGTHITVNSGVYQRKIKEISPDTRVFAKACPLLVPLVEEGWIKKPETAGIIKKYLHPLKAKQIDTLILACTHYPILKKTIQGKMGKRVRLVDSSEAVANRIKDFLETHPQWDQEMGRNNKLSCYASDVTDQFVKTARMIIPDLKGFTHVRI